MKKILDLGKIWEQSFAIENVKNLLTPNKSNEPKVGGPTLEFMVGPTSFCSWPNVGSPVAEFGKQA